MSDIQREQRKNEHVEIAMAQQDVPQSDFDRMRDIIQFQYQCESNGFNESYFKF